MLLPMLVVPAQEIIDGNMERLNLIRDFKNKLEEHPLNAVWTEKKKQEQEIIKDSIKRMENELSQLKKIIKTEE